MVVTGWTPPWRSRYKHWWLALVSVWLSWLILSALLVPWWLNNRLPPLLREQQGLLLHTESTRFNPFTLAVTARGLDLRLGGGEPLLALRELRINLSLLSVFRAAIGFDEIALVEPTLTLMLYADGSSNWQRIGAEAAAAPIDNSDDTTPPVANTESSNADLPRLLLHHFELSGGAIALQDFRLHDAGRHSGIAGLGITLDDVSTLPDDQGNYRVQGQLPGDGHFAWRGQVSLNPLASQGELQLTDVALTPLAPLLLPEPGELSGALNAEARYQFARAGNHFRFQLLEATSKLRDFHWQLPGDQAPRLDWPLLAIDGVTLDTDSQLISIGRVALESAQLQLARDEAGAVRGLAATATVESKTPAGAEPVPPSPQLQSPQLQSQQLQSTPAAAPAWAIKLTALDISSLSLSLTDDSRQLPLQAGITDLNLHTAVTLDLASAGVVLDQLKLDIAELQLAERVADATRSDAAIASVQAVSLTAGRVDTASRAFAADQVSLGAGQLWLRRQADGAIWPLAFLAERQPSVEVAPPWSYALASILVQQVAIALTDEMLQPAATLALQLDRLALAPLANRNAQTSQLELVAQWQPGGVLTFAGSVAADQSAVTGQLALTSLPLTTVQPYLQAALAAEIASGSLSSRGELQATGLNGAPRVRYRGDASIDKFLLTAAATPLLGWQQLQAKRLTLDSAPLALSIDQLRWAKPIATLHFAADGSSNFSALTAASAPAATGPVSAAETVNSSEQKTTAAAPTAAGPSVRIKRIDLLDGALDFADARLVLPYRADIRQFNGSVTGLSSAPDSRATVALEGQVDAYGRAQLDGELQPLAPTAWLDLMLRFRNVALVPFTPYSATFAGRKITEGTLTMDLRYRVQDGKLQGENRVVLDKFSLGERVESPDAMSLPLDLALAILRDSNGRIDLDMPVEGDVNDPQFRYGKVIWQAVVNVLTKIVTSPFRALASLFGDDSEVVEAIVFEPGRRQLTPPELEKLDRLAAVIKQRPDLRLNIRGPFDPVQDEAALKVEQLRRLVATRLGLNVAANSAPAPIALTDPDNQKALEDLYDQHFGAPARAAKLSAENQSRKPPYQTVNRLLAAFGGGAGDAAWYGLLQTDLERAQTLPANLLLQLAETRADQVLARLSTVLPATQWQREPAAAVTDSQNNAIALGLALAPVSASLPAPVQAETARELEHLP